MLRYRLLFFQSLFLIILGIFFTRLVYLQIIKHPFYVKKSEQQLEKLVPLSPKRGTIFDRNKTPLAITKPAVSIYAIPSQIKNKNAFSQVVGPILGRPWQKVYQNIQGNSNFVWLSRRADLTVQTRLKKMNLDGINFIREERRIYPHNRIASHVLGFVGIDNQGLGGIEYVYDHLLGGAAGNLVLEGDPSGRQIVSGFRRSKPAQDGANIFLTLDEYVQYTAEKYLRKTMIDQGALSGGVIVMEPKTGDILAMSSWPDYDPNTWIGSSWQSLKNRCIADVYEPGSVFKVVTISSAIGEKIVTPGTHLQVPQSIVVSTRKIREAHGRSPEETDTRTASEIIEKSLNVGTSLLAMKVGKTIFHKDIEAFGFGKKSGIELPGETAGILRSVKRMTRLDTCMISFGQGISVTPLQIAAAVNVIANKGVYVKPRRVRYTTDAKALTLQGGTTQEKPHVVSQKTAQWVKQILADAVEKGTGKAAKIGGYSLAGKTGTAQKTTGSGGYIPGQYIASFVGFFPIKDPKLLILTVIDSPSKSIYGSVVAAPLFRQIAADLIRYYDIPPDRPEDLTPTANTHMIRL